MDIEALIAQQRKNLRKEEEAKKIQSSKEKQRVENSSRALNAIKNSLDNAQDLKTFLEVYSYAFGLDGYNLALKRLEQLLRREAEVLNKDLEKYGYFIRIESSDYTDEYALLTGKSSFKVSGDLIKEYRGFIESRYPLAEGYMQSNLSNSESVRYNYGQSGNDLTTSTPPSASEIAEQIFKLQQRDNLREKQKQQFEDLHSELYAFSKFEKIPSVSGISISLIKRGKILRFIPKDHRLGYFGISLDISRLRKFSIDNLNESKDCIKVSRTKESFSGEVSFNFGDDRILELNLTDERNCSRIINDYLKLPYSRVLLVHKEIDNKIESLEIFKYASMKEILEDIVKIGILKDKNPGK